MLTKFLRSNIFAKNVLTLMTGAVLAQAVPVAIIPILTRVFSPENFGLLALYGAFVSVLGVVATGRYEIAIMLPKEDEDAKILLQISAFVAFSIAIMITVPIVLWNNQIAVFLGNPDIALWLHLVPLSIFLTGVYEALTYWNNRQKKFKITALSRINQSVVQSSVQTGLAFLKLSGGLIIGQFIGLLSSVIYLLIKDKNYAVITKKRDKRRVKIQLYEYQKFPKYNMLGALCDSAATQMPVLILTKLYSSGVTGMFSLTFRVLSMPTSIISSAISQVLFQKVVELSHTEPHRLKSYIVKAFVVLFVVYLPAVPVLLIWGDGLFAFIFGEEWRQAGVYAGYLVIAVAIRFAVSPLSVVMALDKNILKGLIWKLTYICTIIPTLYIFSMFPIEQFIIAFVVHEVVLYMIYLVLIINSAKAI